MTHDAHAKTANVAREGFTIIGNRPPNTSRNQVSVREAASREARAERSMCESSAFKCLGPNSNDMHRVVSYRGPSENRKHSVSLDAKDQHN